MRNIDRNWHMQQLRELVEKLNEFDSNYDLKGVDGVILNATKHQSNSKFGIVIIPALGVPREAYYKLMDDFSAHNVMVYDSRGQSFSEGEFDFGNSVIEVNRVGKQFKEAHDLEKLVGVGFSYGANCLLEASKDKGEGNHPYDMRFAFAPVVDVADILKFIPKWFVGVFLENKRRAKAKPEVYASEIAEHYLPISLADYCIETPRLLALNMKNPKRVREELAKIPNLLDSLPYIQQRNTWLLYAGKDSTLGIKDELRGSYLVLKDMCRKRGIPLEVFKNHSHRFNHISECDVDSLVVSYNTKLAPHYVLGNMMASELTR